MNMQESLMLANWRQLEREQQRELFNQILLYYVNPLLQIGQTDFVSFSIGGERLTTLATWIQGERFIFIPGQELITVGWTNEGASLDWAAFQAVAKQNPSKLADLAAVQQYVERFTSTPREATLAPLLVAERALPADQQVRGLYQSVTGRFTGDQSLFHKYRRELMTALQPKAEALNPFVTNAVAAQLTEHLSLRLLSDGINYQVCELVPTTYGQLKQQVEKRGFDLTTPAEWEYLANNGQTTLFPWGNQITAPAPVKNGFNLEISQAHQAYELTDDLGVLKLGPAASDGGLLIEQQLPQSAYYQLATAVTLEQALPPQQYTYRKVIRVTFD
ncbi:hypothetical protein [Loigolactobacillus jiayinensis]|uniref:Sulfatase-modifying factor enzyme domain-containing protein n=1 Tax=Loigolactobacillus jiayinensis TaxID=2486016 RepID=A0ABW1RE26_9LACO|nr:hypothetical protein [Loigolactobacillus jiayinensis]